MNKCWIYKCVSAVIAVVYHGKCRFVCKCYLEKEHVNFKVENPLPLP